MDVQIEQHQAPSCVQVDADAADALALAQRRERARLAQQRSRARRKEETEALSSAVAAAETALQRERDRLVERSRHCSALHARIVAASRQLDQLRDQDRRQSPATVSACTAAHPVPDHAPPQGAAHLGVRPCALFVDLDARPNVHTVRLSGGVLRGAGGGRVNLDVVMAFREDAARRLGCRVQEVRWLYETECYPELMRDGAISTDISTPACVAKDCIAWMSTVINYTALHRICKRLEAHRAQLAAQPPPCALAPLFVPRFHRPLPGDVPLGESPRPACCSASAAPAAAVYAAWGAPAAERTAGGALPGALPPPMCDESCEVMSRRLREALEAQTAWSTAGVGAQGVVASDGASDGARLTALARQVLTRVVADHLPRMHPADAARAFARLQAHFMAAPPSQRLRKTVERDGAPIPLALFDLVSAAGHEVFRATIESVRANPQVPTLPTTVEAVDAALREADAALATMFADFDTLLTLMTLDTPRVTAGMMQGLRPIALGYDKYEAINTAGYAALQLTAEQKHVLTRLWSAHQRSTAGLRAEWDACLCRLSAPTAAADTRSASISGTGSLPSADSRDSGDLANAAPPPRDAAPAASEMLARIERLERVVSAIAAAAPAAAQPGASAAGLLQQELRELRRPLSPPAPAAAAPLRADPAERPAVVDSAGDSAAGQASAAPPPPFGWARDVLGACPDATERAAAAVVGLKAGLSRQNLLRLRLLEGVCGVISPRQRAAMLASSTPFVVDLFRLPVLAANDIMRDRVYAQSALCWRPRASGFEAFEACTFRAAR